MCLERGLHVPEDLVRRLGAPIVHAPVRPLELPEDRQRLDLPASCFLVALVDKRADPDHGALMEYSFKIATTAKTVGKKVGKEVSPSIFETWIAILSARTRSSLFQACRLGM